MPERKPTPKVFLFWEGGVEGEGGGAKTAYIRFSPLNTDRIK